VVAKDLKMAGRKAIKQNIQNELWGRAAGRCQFCNMILYRAPESLESVNIAQKAHISGYSKGGPRYRFIDDHTDKVNDIENLMLLCHPCHVTIDSGGSIKYPTECLKKLKEEHENRVEIVSGIIPANKTHVVLYGANIGEQRSPIQKQDAYNAIIPARYPVSLEPVILSINSISHEDKDDEYWQTEIAHLSKIFEQRVIPIIESDSIKHFTLFPLAPIPLLIYLGTLFTDKTDVEVRQLSREPKTWTWQEEPDNFDFMVTSPTTNYWKPTLLLSLSAKIAHSRIPAVLGQEVDIWEISTPESFQHNDFLKTHNQLSLFRKILRKTIENIASMHGNLIELHIFPAIPVSCAVELGRIRMPKASMPWIIYDQNNKAGKFINTITIKESV
jgi:hypothetical protein